MTKSDFDEMLVKDMAAFEHDPLGFAKYAFDWGHGELKNWKGLKEWQAEELDYIGKELRRYKKEGVKNQVIRLANATGHGLGKSCLASIIMLWAMSTKENTRGVVTANTEKQLQTKTWPELSKWYNRLINKHWFKFNATSLHCAEKDDEKTWRIDAIPWSISNTEAFAGLHNEGKRILIIFDEASAIPDIIWEVTEGALTDEDTEIIWITFGNPTRATGRFRECFRRFRKHWKATQRSSRGVEGINQQQIAEWDETHGKDSDFVKVRVDGKFPNQSIMQFIADDLAENAFGRHLNPDQYSFAPTIIGVDPAWTGEDELVIVMRQGLRSEILRRIPKNDDDVAIATLVAQYEDKYEADAVFIDLGYGTGIYSVGKTLNRNWQLIGFGEKALNPGFANRRAEMWSSMKQWLKDGGAIPPIQELKDDLTGVETVPRMDGKIQLESKKDMKERGLPSPNIADALALTFAAPVKKKSSYRKTLTIKRDYDPFA
jgi:hypothetical protein